MEPLQMSSAQWRVRTLADSGLAGAPAQVYKSDQRSRVWRVEGGDGPCVVKRFVHAPFKQRLAMMFRNHPAQCELRMNERLRNAGVAVAPIIDAGVERAALGAHLWLATSWVGTSLQIKLRTDDRVEPAIDAAVELARNLLDAGYWFKDLKPSNIIVDEHMHAWLIDVGSARRLTGPHQVRRMLAVMDQVMIRDGCDPVLRQRFARPFE